MSETLQAAQIRRAVDALEFDATAQGRMRALSCLRNAADNAQAARRDQFAAAALTGLIAARECNSVDTDVRMAVRYADALLAALDGTEAK